MKLEYSMATRTRTNLNGDVGEAEVLKDFLQMGASVNSLTGADNGLDLHVQVPLEPQEYGKLKEAWPLSGRVSHVQVKNMTSLQNPSVPPERIRGWIAGSEVGVPTFVIVLKGGRRLFMSPRDLRTVLTTWETKHAEGLMQDEENEAAQPRGQFAEGDDVKPKVPDKVTLSGTSQHPFEPKTFPWLLHLWTRYSGVMMRTDVEDWLYLDDETLTRSGHQLISEVVLAWMKSHYSDVPLRHDSANSGMTAGQYLLAQTDALPGVLPIALSGYRAMYGGAENAPETLQTMAIEALEILGAAVETCGYRWPEARLMTSYATSTDPEMSMREASQLVHEIMTFHYNCRVAWHRSTN
jgi:hypothetical protein